MSLNSKTYATATVSKASQFERIQCRPVISAVQVDHSLFKGICPQHAISTNPDRIDLGKCNFCGACAETFPFKVSFTDDQVLATNVRDRLIVLANEFQSIEVDPTLVRPEVRDINVPLVLFSFGGESGSFSFGDPNPLRLSFSNAAANCCGLLLHGTAEIDEEAFAARYAELQNPKLLIVAGAVAIAAIETNAFLSNFFNTHRVDLYLAGDMMNASLLDSALQRLIKTLKTF